MTKRGETNYRDAVRYLLGALPMYQRVGSDAYKADLQNAYRMDEYFGHQHQFFKSVHIAGTNGKGSVSHMLASVLQHSGYKTGLFTSPHLLDFRERIRINGKLISESFITQFTEKHFPFFEKIKPSFFEMSVFLAYAYFAREKVDIAVIETGLGGRLDTTNIITPVVSVITNIGLDHTHILGNTLKAIAYEKGGIIKEKIPVVIGEKNPETETVFKILAGKHHAPLNYAFDQYTIDFQMTNPDGSVSSHFSKCFYWEFDKISHDLRGFYQKKNIPAVLMTLAILKKQNLIDLNKNDIIEGLRNVCTTTGLAGRWQETDKYPLVVCDIAHNADGFAEIIEQVKSIPYKLLHMVLGFVNDKDIRSIVRMLPAGAMYYLCKADIPRAKDVEQLAEYFDEFGYAFHSFRTVAEAYRAALDKATKDDLIYVGGSTFIVADFLKLKK